MINQKADGVVNGQDSLESAIREAESQATFGENCMFFYRDVTRSVAEEIIHDLGYVPDPVAHWQMVRDIGNGDCMVLSFDPEGTAGVIAVIRSKLSGYRMHKLNGTYDALSIQEKHRLSSSPGTVDEWLRQFDQCHKPRPGDGCK